MVEGPGVELEDTFSKQLERQLQVEAPHVEVINAGTGDYSTDQELLWLEELGLVYEPDLVILSYYLNDPRTFSRPAESVAWVNNSFTQYSALYTFYRNLVREQMAAETVNRSDFRFRWQSRWREQKWVDDPLELTRLIQEADQDWGLSWYPQKLSQVEADFLQMIALGQTHGFALMLLLIPVDVQVYAQVDTPLDLTAPQYELTHFANSHHIPLVDVLPVLQANQQEDLYFDQVHFKVIGHRLVAEALYEALLPIVAAAPYET